MLEFILKYWLEALFSVMVGILGYGFKILKKQYKEDSEERKAIKLGMQAILRDRLIQAYNYYMEKGCLPIHDRQNLLNMYNQYHTLGANGVIDDLMDELFDLPYGERECK